MYCIDDGSKVEMFNFVGNLQNKSKLFDIDDMIGVCKRKGNKKRDFLFVNNFQGKHIPQSPTMIIKLFEELLDEIKQGINMEERILVVGFAETATAIGQYIANNLDNCVYRLQTTREELLSTPKLINFEEEHSHAVGQYLYIKGKLPDYDRVLFIEDEITTGKTILNFITEFEKINSNTKYAVASILNLQNQEDTEKYKEKGIDTYYIVRGNLKENLIPIEVIEKEVFHLVKDSNLCNEPLRLNYPFTNNEREGDYPVATKKVIEDLEFIDDYLKRKEIITTDDKKILVVGTEECMYLPLIIAKNLEDAGLEVKYHATTRSPITISDDLDYIITEGVSLTSAYDEGRTTYLYNYKSAYDKVIVITDKVVNEKFKKDIMSIWEQDNVFIIQFI